MTNHPNRHPGAAMRRESYLKIAKTLRETADKIEANAGRETAQQKRALSLAIHNLPSLARRWLIRHQNTVSNEQK